MKNRFTFLLSIFALTFSTLVLIDTVKRTDAAPAKNIVSRGKYTVTHWKWSGANQDEYQAKDFWLYGGAMTITKMNDKKTTLMGGVAIAHEN